MSEAIISRAGGSSGGSKKFGFKTEIFIENTMWNVPEAENNEFSVRIFGGGGGGITDSGWSGGGGGGGEMNNSNITLQSGTQVPIVIGKGGNGIWTYGVGSDGSKDYNIRAESGGTSCFGSFLSANGGEGSRIMVISWNNAYNWAAYTYGGNGGAGGGSKAVRRLNSGYTSNNNIFLGSYAGSGSQFGGGSAMAESSSWPTTSEFVARGGEGGIWGGGGGVYCDFDYNNNIYRGTPGRGGKYGGNGGNKYNAAQNGTNTIGWTNVDMDISNTYITGYGKATGTYNSGGGGYGGCGGTGWGGGGGGYGANGGDSFGGGGGGYGAGHGGTNAFNAGGAGGGSYGKGGDCRGDGVFGGGGGCGGNGGDGICIIQYYGWTIEN